MVERKVGQLVASMVEETAELRDEKMADKTDVVKVGKMVAERAERSVVKREGMKVGKMVGLLVAQRECLLGKMKDCERAVMMETRLEYKWVEWRERKRVNKRERSLE